ncbi:MAG: hypothetical protein WD971_08535 [Pirellulales bacterium]
MFWRLTRIGLLISLAAGVAGGQSPPPGTASGGAKTAPTAAHSVQWEQVPLGDAIGRLKGVSGAEVLLDRRVDPTQRVDLKLEDAGVEEIVARLAAACSLGHTRLERLFYIGPPQTAQRLVALAALRRRDVAAVPAELRRSLSERRRIVWPPLTEPRGLVTRLVEEHGWRLLKSERIPHDLWAGGALPTMTLADQLTVLLAGFDRTYRVLPYQRAIEIVPVDWDAIEPTSKKLPANNRSARVTPGGKQVFTLRIENQPVGKVLDQLGRRLGWQLAVDEAAIRAAGCSLDQRVSFTVENADEDQLLNALLTPAGLTAERDGEFMRVTPR